MSDPQYPVWYFKLLGGLFTLCTLIILFLAPTEALYENSRRMHLGDIFRGLEALIGTPGSRLLLAFPFGVVSYLLLRKAFARSTDHDG